MILVIPLVLDAGADDVGFVQIERPELDGQRDDILQAFPRTRTLISYVVRMNREPIRTPARSVANLEFHHVGDAVNEIGRKLVRTLEDKGVRALNPAMGFPMEMDKFPGKIWVVSHKPVAVAAGHHRHEDVARFSRPREEPCCGVAAKEDSTEGFPQVVDRLRKVFPVVAIEALGDCLQQSKATPGEIDEAAKIDRVGKTVRGYGSNSCDPA